MTAAERTYLDGLVKEEQGRLLNFIRTKVGDEEDSRDILQDVLFQLTAGFDDIRTVNTISSWLFTVARNRITDYFRKSKPEPGWYLRLWGGSTCWRILQPAPGPAMSTG